MPPKVCLIFHLTSLVYLTLENLNTVKIAKLAIKEHLFENKSVAIYVSITFSVS